VLFGLLVLDCVLVLASPVLDVAIEARRQRQVVAFGFRRSLLQGLLLEPLVVAAPHALETVDQAHRAEITP
jgi:hypothetical protein